jgi:hypothetical protein
MSLRVNNMRGNTLETITADANIAVGASATTVSIGTTTSVVNLPNLGIGSYKSNTFQITTQTNTFTIANLLSFQIFVSDFSSTNPATVNDIITVNLPTPTADIEGIIYTFRKIRGAFSTSGNNWAFNFATASYVANNNSLTTTGQPVSVFNTGAIVVRLVVVGDDLGSYYWILG